MFDETAAFATGEDIQFIRFYLATWCVNIINVQVHATKLRTLYVDTCNITGKHYSSEFDNTVRIDEYVLRRWRCMCCVDMYACI